MELVWTAKDGMRVRLSTRRAIPLRSTPVIMGMGVPAMATKAGVSLRAASTMSSMMRLSLPSTASISVSAEMQTDEGIVFPRG